MPKLGVWSGGVFELLGVERPCNGDRVCVGGAVLAAAGVRIREGEDPMSAAEGSGVDVSAEDVEEGVFGS